jgi:hypothetical protein
MDGEFVELLLGKLGGNIDREFEAIDELKKLEIQLPSVLLKKYRVAKKWQTRCSCVYHSITYSRVQEDAVQLGLEALFDRSKVVRYRACMLLACSLNKRALPSLREVELNAKDSETKENAHAAIDAIENQNTNWFVDRSHSGKVTLTFQ